MGEQVMEDIVKTEEGQRFYDFLYIHWGTIMEMYNNIYARQGPLLDAINRISEAEGYLIDRDLMEENEFDEIIQYFISVGSAF
jgi:hypothetical protein